ncbi:MAG: hypothetical protein D6822_02860, partial [Cyanobacteria bacterium J149]
MQCYIDYLLKHGVSKKTSLKYANFIRQLIKEYGQITEDFQDRFVIDKLDKWSKNSITTYLKAVRHYAAYKGIKLHKCSFNNLRQATITPTFSEDEIYSMTEYLIQQWHEQKNSSDRWAKQRAKWSIFWLLVMWTGCRCGEIAGLTHRQVNLSSNTIIINATKTNSIRNVPIVSLIRQCVYEYLGRCGMSLFPNVHQKSWSRSFHRLLNNV